jgi:4'-phosphopantetheinyl transferase
VKPGEIHVWRVRLVDANADAHVALRTILERQTTAQLKFALGKMGKPYLPAAPELKFNLSHSHGMALVAVALEVEVGVDVEQFRPLPDYAAIAERYFPPGEPDVLDAHDFFRRWTRIEAMLKARGVGLLGAGTELRGSWTVQEIDAGPAYAAAVAAEAEGLSVMVHDFGGDA